MIEHNYKQLIKDINKIKDLCDKLNDKNEYNLSQYIYNLTVDIEHIANSDLFNSEVKTRIIFNDKNKPLTFK